MTFDQLQYFITTVNSDSFLDAAERLCTTQSTLSKQIKKVEEELHVQLFDRSKRSARLTPAGETFYKEAVQLLAAYHRTLDIMRTYQEDATNELSIGTLPILSQYGLTSRINQFTREHPQIHLSLSEVEERDLMDGMQQDTYNLVITRETLFDPSAWVFQPLATDRLCAILPARHPLAAVETISIADLAEEPLILMHPYTAIYALCLSLFAQTGLQPHILRTARMESIISAVDSYEAISLLPKSNYRLFQSTGTIAIPLTDAPELRVGLAYRQGRRIPPASQAFLEYMVT